MSYLKPAESSCFKPMAVYPPFDGADPGDMHIVVGDVPRFSYGLGADKAQTNLLKMQGAVEYQQSLNSQGKAVVDASGVGAHAHTSLSSVPGSIGVGMSHGAFPAVAKESGLTTPATYIGGGAFLVSDSSALRKDTQPGVAATISSSAYVPNAHAPKIGSASVYNASVLGILPYDHVPFSGGGTSLSGTPSCNC